MTPKPATGLIDERAEHPLEELFEASPARTVHTSAAAQVAFVAGVLALLGAPFTLTFGLTVLCGGLGLVTGVVGLARASRPAIAGGLLASIGLCAALTALILVGLRYAGVDTTFGDAWVPVVRDTLEWLNKLPPGY